MSRLIDHGDDGDEIRTETELEALTGADLSAILNLYTDYGGGELPIRASVPDTLYNRGLRSARLIRSVTTGEWVLHLMTE